MTTIQIPLTQGKVALIDEEDLPIISPYTWHAQKHTHTWYATAYAGGSKANQSALAMHRLILAASPTTDVDHRDGNGLNNTRTNIRLATHAQNMSNRRMLRNNTSGYRGIVWYANYQKWGVRVSHQGKRIFVGYYADPIDAARAYDRMVTSLRGEFARLNFPDDPA